MSVEQKDQAQSIAEESAELSGILPESAQQSVIIRPVRKRHEENVSEAQLQITASRRAIIWPGRARLWQLLQWPARGAWLGFGGWALALYATLLLAQDSTRITAEWLLLAAAVLGLLALRHEKWLPAFGLVQGQALDGARLLARPKLRHWLSLAGFALGALTVWRADSLYLSRPYETFGLAGWLWLLSMALILTGAFAWPRTPANSTEIIATEEEQIPLPANTAVPVRRVVFGSARPVRVRESSVPAWSRREVVALACIMLLALLLRLWDLPNFPFAFNFDEIITGRHGHAYMSGGPYPPVFSTVWEGIDLPALWFTFTATSLNVFGMSLAALRIPAALFGAATVLPFYGIVRGVWGRATALVGASILAFSAADIHYSRVTLNNIVTPFFWAVCFFFLLRGLRTRRPVDWLVAGMAGGLSEYFYYGTRLLPFVLGAFALYLLVVHWRQGWRYMGHFAILALGYLVAFGPLLAYFTAHPDLYFGRSKGTGVLMWDHIPTSWDDLVLMWNTLWPLMSDNLLGISTNLSRDSVYAGSLLMQAEAALLVLGVALLIFRWRQPAAFLMLVAGFGVIFVGGTLIHGTPYLAHWTPAFPAIYAAIAVPVGAWASAGARLPGRGRLIVPIALLVGVVVLGVINVYYYFHQYTARPQEELRTSQDRAQAALGTDYRVFDVGTSNEGWDYESMGYLVPGQEGGNLYNPAAELPLPGKPGKGLGFFFYSDNEHYRSVVRAIYPGGTDGDVTASAGPHLFYSYVLTPEKVAAMYGATLQLFSPDSERPVWSGQVPSIGAIPPGAIYPVRARWSASVYVNATTLYQIRVEGVSANLLVNGQPSNLTGEQTLPAGWNQVIVDAALSAPSKLSLVMGVAGAALAEVPRVQLWPVQPGQGLLGVSNAVVAPQLARVESFIGFTGLGLPGDAGPGQGLAIPVHARWVGAIEAPPGGQTTLGLVERGETRLWIDGKAVFVGCSPDNAAIGAVAQPIGPGRHNLQLDYIAAPGTSTLELYWTPPGGKYTLVPPSALCYLCDSDPLPFPLAGVSPPLAPSTVDCSIP